MSSKNTLLNNFYQNGIRFFCGVPDSLLANFSTELENSKKKITHIITPNEGNAIGVAIGHYLSTNKVPLVYMQNSGLGNAINPLTSLASRNVWKIPLFLLIGWRGSNKLKDEPQHLKQGKITMPLLKLLGISCIVYSEERIKEQIKTLKKRALKNNSPVALVFPEKYKSKNSEKFKTKTTIKDIKIKRIEAIEEVVLQKSKNDILIATTGKISRELYVVQKKLKMPHNDLFVVGGMGHASSIALGILKSNFKNKLFFLDGDGSFLMHMGIISLLGNKSKNTFYHVLLNNECHESVGGQPTSINNLNLKLLTKSCRYKEQKNINKIKQLRDFFNNTRKSKGSFFLNIAISNGSFSPLPRPKEKPYKNFELFKNNFKTIK